MKQPWEIILLKDSGRAKRLKDCFNLTISEWELINRFQHGLCAICGKVQRSGKRLAVDHQHACGLIRGLLCSQCNRLLGRMEGMWGSQAMICLQATLDYLTSPPAVKALGQEVFGYPGRVNTKKFRAFIRKQKRAIIETPLGTK